MKKQGLFIVLFMAGLMSLLAQTNNSGRIIDTDNQSPISGAVIQVRGDENLIITSSSNGIFSFPADMQPDSIIISHAAYITRIISFIPNIQVHLSPKKLILSEVVVTGLSDAPLKNTPTSIQLISSEMIHRDAPYSITNAINRVPGVYMHQGAYNTSRITIRGIGSRNAYGTNRVKAYFEEIPITDGSGNSTIEDLDQNLIGRIEITKGPNSSLYGAGLGGVAHIFAKKTNESHMIASTTGGSFGTWRQAVSGGIINPKGFLNLAFSNLNSDGYRENSDYNRSQGGINFKHQINERNSINVAGVFTKMKAQIASSIGESDYINNPEKAAFTWNQVKGYESYTYLMSGLTYQHDFNTELQIKSTVFATMRDAYEMRPTSIGALDEATQSWGNRTVLYKRSQKASFSTGIEYFNDHFEWKIFESLVDSNTKKGTQGAKQADNTEERSYINVFAAGTFNFTDKANISASLNFNSTNYTLSDQFNTGAENTSGSYSYAPTISPKIGGAFHFGNNHHLYTNISHGFSIPSLEETLYPDGQLNTNIKPETGWNYELGVRGNYRGFSYDMTTYYMKIKNLLVSERIGQDQYMGVNAGLNNHIGIEYLLNYSKSWSDNIFSIFLSGNLNHFEFSEFTHKDINYSGNQLTGIPSVTLNPGIELISETGFYGNLNGQFVGKIPMNDANSLYTHPYLIIRTKAGYTFNWNKFIIDINAGIDNLTDQHYASMILINAVGFGGSEPRYYYPGLPRNVFGGISMRYNF